MDLVRSGGVAKNYELLGPYKLSEATEFTEWRSGERVFEVTRPLPLEPGTYHALVEYPLVDGEVVALELVEGNLIHVRVEQHSEAPGNNT